MLFFIGVVVTLACVATILVMGTALVVTKLRDWII